MLASFFLARRIQPFLSLINREIEFCVLTNRSLTSTRTAAYQQSGSKLEHVIVLLFHSYSTVVDYLEQNISFLEI